MKARILTLVLFLAALVAMLPAYAVTNAVDAVPSATLLLPYFEVSYVSETAPRPSFTIGNDASVETLAHVTLWTDRGVPTYSFDVRLPANGTLEIDLHALFTSGTLPQTTAGGFASCAASLPPPPLSPSAILELQRAHRGQASTLLGGECGGVNYGQAIARGYVTVDVTRACTTLFPGDPAYFVNGGNGIATNDNVIWGESHVTDPHRTQTHGTPMVHIEASASDGHTDGVPGHCPDHMTCPPGTPNAIPDYTFYYRRSGNTNDNREGLPQQWRGRFDITGSPSRPFTRTYALVWRDAGNVDSWPCGAPPAGLPMQEVIAFDDQEQVGDPGAVLTFPYATQKVQIAPSSFLPPGFERGFLHYGLAGFDGPSDVGARRQSYVTHVYEGAVIGSAASAWPLTPITDENPIVLVGGSGPVFAPCGDGIDNDGDTLVDFPNDPGCRSADAMSENPSCNDGFDNDGDTQSDFPNDPQCHAPHDWDEFANYECDDGVDNDGDGKIDWPSDGGCSWYADGTENTDACRDGIDNDGDGLIDLNDPGCGSPFASAENPACNDGIDNDGDGLADFPNDLGCSSASFHIENPPCSDGSDNDGDGLIDFPNDPGCAFRHSFNEAPQCNDGSDNDGDGQIDMADVGCTSPFDTLEFHTQCNDGIDNDGDGLIDFPNENGCSSQGDGSELSDCSDGEDNDCDGVSDEVDPGCANPLDPHEGSPTARACSDGIDNDGDGFADYPADPGCISAYDDVEFHEGTAPAHLAQVPALSPLALLLLAALIAIVAVVALRGTLMS